MSARIVGFSVLLSVTSLYGWLLDFDRGVDIPGWVGAPLFVAALCGAVWSVAVMITGRFKP